MAEPGETQNIPADDPQREQLARLMAWIMENGAQGGKYSPENLWALQARSQWPSPPENASIDLSNAPGDISLTTPMQRFQPEDPTTHFPQAMPGNARTDNPWLSTNPAPAPFHGKGEVIGPYELPKKKSKKKGKD